MSFDIEKIQFTDECEKEKLSIYLEMKNDALSQLQNDVIKKECEYEELKKEHETMRKNLNNMSENEKLLNEKLNSKETKSDETKGELTEIKEKMNSLEIEKNTFMHDIDLLKNKNMELSDLLSKKSIEYESVNNEWKMLTKRVAELTSSESKAITRAELGEMAQSTYKHKLSIEERELEFVKKRLDEMNERLLSREFEIVDLKRFNSTSLLKFNNELDEKIQLVKNLKTSNESFKQTVHDLKQDLNTKNEQFTEINLKNFTFQQNYKNEKSCLNEKIEFQNNLIQELKSKANDGEQQVCILKEHIVEINNEFSQNKEKLKLAMIECDQQMTKTEDENERLKTELKHANQLIKSSNIQYTTNINNAISDLSPSAAVAQKFMKSGQSLTQIYNEYIILTEAYEKEKLERRQVTDSLNHVLNDLEMKTPQIEQLKVNYDKVLESKKIIQKQLQDENVILVSIRKKLNKNHIKYRYVCKENERHKSQILQLSMQVRNLLATIEHERGNLIKCRSEKSEKSQVSQNENEALYMNCDKMSFNDLCGLQKLNIKLIDLLDKQKTKDSDSESDKCFDNTFSVSQESNSTIPTSEITKISVSELNELKNIISSYEKLIETSSQERNFYRSFSTALAKCHEIDIPISDIFKQDKIDISAWITQVVEKINEKMTQYSVKFNDQSSKIDKLKEKHEKYVAAIQKSTSLLKEELEKYKNNYFEVNIKTARLNAELEYANQKVDSANQNYQKCFDELNEAKSDKLKCNEIIAKNESTIAILRSEIFSTCEKSNRFELRFNNNESLYNEMKCNVARLEQENKDLYNQQNILNSMFSNINSLKKSIDQNEQDVFESDKRKMSLYEQQLTASRRTMDQIQSQNIAVVDTLNSQLLDIRSQRDCYFSELSQLKCDNEKLKKSVESLTATCEELTLSLHKSNVDIDEIKNMSVGGDSERNMDQVFNELESYKSKCISLGDSLECSKNNLVKYKALSQSLEAALETEQKSKLDSSSQYIEKIDAIKSECTALHLEIEQSKNDNDATVKSNDELTCEIAKKDKIITELTHKFGTVDENYKDLMKSMNSVLGDLSNSNLNDSELKKEIFKMKKNEMELQENVKQLNLELISKNDEYSKLKDSLESLKNHNNEIKENYLKQELELVQNKNTAIEKLNESIQTNTVLSTKLEQVTSDINLLTGKLNILENIDKNVKNHNDETHIMALLSHDLIAKENKVELVEFIKYLRTENLLQKNKIEHYALENEKLTVQLNANTQELILIRKKLDDEFNNAEIKARTAAQHADLLRRLELMAKIESNNEQLTNECKRSKSENCQLNDKIKLLENDLASFKKTTIELEAKNEIINNTVSSLNDDVNSWKNLNEELNSAVGRNDDINQNLIKNQEENKRLVAKIKLYQKKLNLNSENMSQAKTENERLSLIIDDQIKELEKNKKMTEMIRNRALFYRKQFEELEKTKKGVFIKSDDKNIEIVKSDEELKITRQKLLQVEKDNQTLKDQELVMNMERDAIISANQQLEMKLKNQIALNSNLKIDNVDTTFNTTLNETIASEVEINEKDKESQPFIENSIPVINKTIELDTVSAKEIHEEPSSTSEPEHINFSSILNPTNSRHVLPVFSVTPASRPLFKDSENVLNADTFNLLPKTASVRPISHFDSISTSLANSGVCLPRIAGSDGETHPTALRIAQSEILENDFIISSTGVITNVSQSATFTSRPENIFNSIDSDGRITKRQREFASNSITKRFKTDDVKISHQVDTEEFQGSDDLNGVDSILNQLENTSRDIRFDNESADIRLESELEEENDSYNDSLFKDGDLNDKTEDEDDKYIDEFEDEEYETSDEDIIIIDGQSEESNVDSNKGVYLKSNLVTEPYMHINKITIHLRLEQEGETLKNDDMKVNSTGVEKTKSSVKKENSIPKSTRSLIRKR
ncbi:hypothetical protein A3Q56_02010 [Intoshia linei]|uniref:Nucleoprotein TPR n=1 Tax=Intoshia linei TaxID=1819745 RepID=A0A177B7M1_9BILA|nr:hypothetical protein A3Q56_02010 [Intoshia linei]